MKYSGVVFKIGRLIYSRARRQYSSGRLRVRRRLRLYLAPSGNNPLQFRNSVLKRCTRLYKWRTIGPDACRAHWWSELSVENEIFLGVQQRYSTPFSPFHLIQNYNLIHRVSSHNAPIYARYSNKIPFHLSLERNVASVSPGSFNISTERLPRAKG